MLHLLVIGHSGTTDATRYLHDMAAAAGIELHVVNLYIGGCSLDTHWHHVVKGDAAYLYEENGERTERMVSIQEALAERRWDIIVTQQASRYIGLEHTYHPYFDDLYAYLKEKAPNARLYIMENWAYDKRFKGEWFDNYHGDQAEMQTKLEYCYHAITDQYQLPLIPCGEMIRDIRTHPRFNEDADPDPTGRQLRISRDGVHMDFIYGRYLLAAAWLQTICGVRLDSFTYFPKHGDDPVDVNVINEVRDVVMSYRR